MDLETRRATIRSGVCIAYSPDGIHWTSYDGNPVIEGESDTMNVVYWDAARERYVLCMRPTVHAGPRNTAHPAVSVSGR